MLYEVKEYTASHKKLIVCIIMLALLAVTGLPGRTSYIVSHNMGLQTKAVNSHVYILAKPLSDVQIGMTEKSEYGPFFEETHRIPGTAVNALLFITVLAKSSYRKDYLVKSCFLLNQRMIQILEFIQNIDGKKERTLYYA